MPLTTVTPAAASPRPSERATSSPYWVARRAPTTTNAGRSRAVSWGRPPRRPARGEARQPAGAVQRGRRILEGAQRDGVALVVTADDRHGRSPRRRHRG